MSKSKKKTGEESLPHGSVIKHILWGLAAGAWLLTGAALVSHDPADVSPWIAPLNEQPANWVGQVGALISQELYIMLGPGVWILMAGALVALVAWAIKRNVTQPIIRTLGLVLMSLSVSAMIGLGMTTRLSGPESAGGLIALFINTELTQRFGAIGTVILLFVAFWVGALIALDQLVMMLLVRTGKLLGLASHIRIPAPVLVGKISSSPWLRRGGATVTPDKRRHDRKQRDQDDQDDDHIDESAGGLGATESFDADTGRSISPPDLDEEDYETQDDDEEEIVDSDDVIEQDDEPDETETDAPSAYAHAKRQWSPDELRAKIKQLPIKFANPGQMTAPPPREVDLSGYKFPDVSLLEEPASNFTDEIEALVRESAVKLESALQQYRIEGEVVGIDSGPTITLYEVRLAPGTKVARVQNVASDLARALKAQNIRVVPNMAGRDTVGIEVPNLKKEKVRLKELMTSDNDLAKRMKLPMWLGKDASGNPLIADLAAMPHMLIAGTTGSGKSVCMNSILMSFLFTKRPDELKLVLVDPKMVEMSMFKDVPHLMCPVVTEMNKAAAILEWATTKMDERYELLAEAGVRDVAGYNELTDEERRERFSPANEEEEARIPKKLPFLVFVVDELADMMMTNKEVEGYIVRLAQKSRAVGMHLILATQRPQANVVTGLIKSNMPCRVSFKVASGMDSRIVLDQKGAELLLGYGDMLYLSPRTSKLTRAQGTLVDDLEIRKTVKFLKEVASPSFEPQLVQIKTGAAGSSLGDEERDPLFDDAVDVVLETQRGSVSLLQRRLTIGYGRASRLIEVMGELGILGQHKGSQAREVMISLDEWEAMKAQAQADAANGTLFADTTQVDDEQDVEEDEDEIQDELEYEELDEEDDDDDDEQVIEDEAEEWEEEEEDTH